VVISGKDLLKSSAFEGFEVVKQQTKDKYFKT